MRRKWLVIVVCAALLAGVTAPAAAESEGSAGDGLFAADPAAWTLPPDFTARGGLNQVFVTDADPGDPAQLIRWGQTAGGALTITLADSGVVDDQGSLMFREVEWGLYIVAVGSRVDWVVAVGDADDSTPDQSFYDDQELVEGFQYIETRDGTTLSAYVVLPGPPEEGPYPTVVEYSGYNPSDPISGLGSLAGGLNPEPLCPALPILCKAPAQPASLIAGLFGYAVVGVNVRGTGCSGGAYDFFEPMQVLDGYDVIEAVAAQDWVLDHKVGMVGLSYPGISQLFVAKSDPPSLGAISPLSVYADTATGVLAPGGLLNTGFATEWADNVLGNAQPYGTSWVRELIEEGDTECDDNQQLRLQNVDATAKARANVFYTDEVAGPLDIRNWVRDIDVPVFLASAFGDEQTGPSFGDLLGNFDSSPSARQIIYNGLHADGFAPQILREWAAFLDIYLAGEVPSVPGAVGFLTPLLTGGIFGGGVPLPPDRWAGVATHADARAQWESEDEIRVLMESGAGGTDNGLPVAAWEFGTDQWPPSGTVVDRHFLGAAGTLDHAATDSADSGGAGSAVQFFPDPAVATTDFHTSGSIWDKDQAWDWQAQADGDNARFQTAPLTEDLVLAGTASVDLWLKSDADEAELEAVLSEIDPDGNETRVQSGLLQASYRALDASSTELQPVQYGREAGWAPLVPGEWTEARIQIPAFAHAFRAGSSIRLTINTPGGDHARWQFELDGPGAEATHVIGTGGDHASSIALPLVAGLDVPTPRPDCGALRGQPCRTAPAIRNVVEGQCPIDICPLPDTLNADRPAPVVYPSDYDPNTEYPLVVVLHGLGAWGTIQSLYMGITQQVDERDFVLVMPDGTLNASGQRFWDTGASCCGPGTIDDVGYITELIAEAKAEFNIDADRVYLVGHSNGGFMSFTMACERSEIITAIMSLAGSSFATDEQCAPHTDAVGVLQIHGTADDAIPYEGRPGEYPGAEALGDRHAAFNGCDLDDFESRPDLDLEPNLPGAETSVVYRADDCVDGMLVELWTIDGGSHIPPWTPVFAPTMLDWLLALSKP